LQDGRAKNVRNAVFKWISRRSFIARLTFSITYSIRRKRSHHGSIKKSQGSYNDADWYGVRRENKPGEQAGMTVARLVREGWPEGVRLMEQVQSQIAPPQARSIRRRAQWSDQGDDLNLQRLYAGNIDRHVAHDDETDINRTVAHPDHRR
jgi:hypothetical protein